MEWKSPSPCNGYAERLGNMQQDKLSSPRSSGRLSQLGTDAAAVKGRVMEGCPSSQSFPRGSVRAMSNRVLFASLTPH